MENLGTALTGATSEILERIVSFLPSLLGGLLLMVVGWLLARRDRAAGAGDAVRARHAAPT